MTLLSLLLACASEKDADGSATPPPYGMPLTEDGTVYAGIARIDITPTDFETYTDLNGNHAFDGCVNDPGATRSGCDEPFDDLDGDGRFDAVWIAGFGSARAALGVHDAMTVTALVVALDGEYVALVGVDALGVLENRIRDARDLLAADGFDRDRVVVSSSHTHQGPDTVGIYGIDEDVVSGVYDPYVESIAPAVRDAIQTAAGTMVAVTPRQGALRMRDWDAALNGAPFGGINPDASVEGGINDIRDPIIAADQVLAVAFEDAAGNRVATMVSASGHPEVVGSDNDLLSADYVHYTRSWIEEQRGGLAVFLSGALGGMQSALGAPLPSLDAQGQRVLDTEGAPVFTDEESFAFAQTYGTLVAQAAEDALTDTTPWERLRVAKADVLLPVDNISFKLAFQLDLLDTPEEYIVQDDSCPGWGDPDLFGCVPTGVWQIEMGPVGLGSVPGELMPELFWGVPDEPAMEDAALRSTDRRWVQYDADCADVDYEECRDRAQFNDCDCLQNHVAPYVARADGGPAIESLLPGTFKAPIGIANGYCGYIVPDPDFNTYVSVLTDNGDHYEETNSCSRSLAPLLFEAFEALQASR